MRWTQFNGRLYKSKADKARTRDYEKVGIARKPLGHGGTVYINTYIKQMNIRLLNKHVRA